MEYDGQINVRLPQEIIARLNALPEANSAIVRRAILLFLEQTEIVTLEILNAKLDKILSLLEELKP